MGVGGGRVGGVGGGRVAGVGGVGGGRVGGGRWGGTWNSKVPAIYSKYQLLVSLH